MMPSSLLSIYAGGAPVAMGAKISVACKVVTLDVAVGPALDRLSELIKVNVPLALATEVGNGAELVWPVVFRAVLIDPEVSADTGDEAD